MTAEFCTLFDRNYLPRALSLYRSLESVCGDFRLRAFCMDEATAPILRRLGLERLDVVTPEELAELDPDLAAVRGRAPPSSSCGRRRPLCASPRSRASLGWRRSRTSTPTSSSAPIPHRSSRRSAPTRWRSSRTGTPSRTGRIRGGERDLQRRVAHLHAGGAGAEALRWWRERCLEWCKVVPEDGKFGDQTYLDDWPERFPGVHVIEHVGAGLAPWNVDDYEVWRDPASGAVQVDDVPLVFFHVHGLRLFRPGPLSPTGGAARRVQRHRRPRWGADVGVGLPRRGAAAGAGLGAVSPRSRAGIRGRAARCAQSRERLRRARPTRARVRRQAARPQRAGAPAVDGRAQARPE